MKGNPEIAWIKKGQHSLLLISSQELASWKSANGTNRGNSIYICVDIHKYFAYPKGYQDAVKLIFLEHACWEEEPRSTPSWYDSQHSCWWWRPPGNVDSTSSTSSLRSSRRRCRFQIWNGFSSSKFWLKPKLDVNVLFAWWFFVDPWIDAHRGTLVKSWCHF